MSSNKELSEDRKLPMKRRRAIAMGFRTDYKTWRNLQMALWVMKQGPEGGTWTRIRVIERALEKYAQGLETGFPNGFPPVSDATLEAL